ncbi:Tetratricopeptide repeat 6 [Brachionus plicatilis]|uniref:Tetratricopeptide repeat 6 n=1 Tax=Brachionus plicatilis TaxID=10195 RepID=A0A3M7RJ71_BRAPC|nr:Tetratricopeptide repeat 6 [Brachionus plicatilis]
MILILYDEAIKDFESVLLLDKEYSPAYVNLGIIYMNLTMNYWKAIKYFNLAIKSNPVYIRAYLCRAQAYRYVHDLKRAYLDYTKAIHMDPTNTQIYIYRGQTILEMGDLKLAAFCVQYASFMKDNVNSRASNDNDFGTVINRGGSAKIRSKNEGISTLSSMTNSVAAQNQSVTQQALVFSFLKNHDKAISVLEQELKVKATTSIYNLLGRVYMKAKKWKEAVMAFEKSIDLNFDETKSSKNMSTTSSSFSKMANLTGLKANKKDLIDAYFMKGQCFIETKHYTDAYSSFDKVIDLNPENAQAFYHRGIARVHLKHQRCIQDFNKALALDPSLFEAFLARACIYGMQERYTKAILNCNEAVRLNSKSVRGYLYRGALKYMSRSFNYAIKDLTEAINLDQTCALAYFNRALCYEQIQSFKNALKDFSIVLMLGDFLKFKVLINRGLLYFHTKDYFNALNDFKMAAVYSPSDFDIQHMIGLCLHKLERYSEAISVLSEAYQINPRFFNALISRGNVYVDLGHDKAFEKAQKDYGTVLDLYPDNLDAHINLAYLFQITGRFKLAWDQFTKAIQLKPKFIPAYEGRSVVCLQMSDTLAALKDINQAIKIRPNAELLVNRGVIYQFMADNVNAMRDYQSALLMDPMFGLAYFNSANVLLLHKQFSQALKNLDMAIDKCHMKDESTYQNRAIARALAGDISGAFRDLCEAIKYGKYTSHLFMNRGILLYKMENYKLADKDFSTAISLSPNDAVLYKLRADCKGKLDMKDEALVDYQMAVDLKQREKF